MVKRDVIAGRQLIKIRVVGHDRRNIHRQQTALVAKQQVIQTMAEYRNHQQHARLLGRIKQLPIHLQAVGQYSELIAQLLRSDSIFFGREMHAHEEQARLGIAELRRIDDVAAMLGKKTENTQHKNTQNQTKQKKKKKQKQQDKQNTKKTKKNKQTKKQKKGLIKG